MKILTLALLTLSTVVGLPLQETKSEPFSYPVSNIVSVTPNERLSVASRASRNRLLARDMAKPYGWSVGKQWKCLVTLWQRESRWDEQARNRQSGAYGIPQKMGTPIRGAAKQIRWGLAYIDNRYGSPCRALSHSYRKGWY